MEQFSLIFSRLLGQPRAGRLLLPIPAVAFDIAAQSLIPASEITPSGIHENKNLLHIGVVRLFENYYHRIFLNIGY
jgi:hypothetical protein